MSIMLCDGGYCQCQRGGTWILYSGLRTSKTENAKIDSMSSDILVDIPIAIN